VKASEETTLHTRIMRCDLAVAECRAWWERRDDDEPPANSLIFEQQWFGAKSEARVALLAANLKVRFEAFPGSLEALHAWRSMPPPVRVLICHWHLQLADPLYRAFTGGFLLARRQRGLPDVRRETVVDWVDSMAPGRWALTSRKQFASKLLGCARVTGLVQGAKDPRPLTLPAVPDDAILYLLYLLRGIEFAGGLDDNPYLAGVGLQGPALHARLSRISALGYRRTGDLVSFDWAFPTLFDWVFRTHGGDP